MVARPLSSVMCSALSVADGSPLPTEFRIFAPGLNATQKGDFLFDAEAARNLMNAYRLSNARIVIDLEHDSLHPERRAHRADAGDARGWASLELRADGSLWACSVTWTPDGERRLRERTQAYISPAFVHEELSDGTMRPYRLVNMALCAAPAMNDAPALVAASQLHFGPKRSPRVLAALARAASVISYRKGTR
jgi:phage I-like protein